MDYSKHSLEELNQLMKDVVRQQLELERTWIELARAKAKKIGSGVEIHLNSLLSRS